MNSQLPSCPICGENLAFSLARGRKSGKPSIMLLCKKDGRHFRGFITDRPFVEATLKKMELIQQPKADEDNPE